MKSFLTTIYRFPSFHFSCFIILFFLLLGVPQPGFCAVELRVSVDGVEGKLQENILARLKIYLQQENPRLTIGEIRRLHKKAPEEIALALTPFGYYSVEVAGSLDEDNEGWHAAYSVTAGNPVKISQVDIEYVGAGESDPALSSLKKLFPLKKGDVLDHSLYESGKKELINLAMTNGYIKAQLKEHTIFVSPEQMKADIQIKLDTGPLFVFGETKSDQQVIDKKLLFRFLPYQEGDVYSLKALNEFQTSLYSTEYFSQVLIEPKLEQTDNFSIPVEVSLIQGKPNRYSFGIGYGTDTGFRSTLGWNNRLLNSHGHKINSSVRLSENDSLLSASYLLPVLDPRYDTLAFGINWIDETWEDTSTELISGVVSLNHKGPTHQLGVNFEIRDEQYRVGSTSGSALLLMPGASWTMTLSENPVNTVEGLRLNLNLKGADKNVVSSTSFIQAKFSAKAIYTFFKHWRLIGRFTTGTTAMESIDELPPSLRFYAGGDNSVRGYDYKSLGPKDESGVVIGGQYLMEASGEIERKITQLWSVAAFYDMGNAMDDIEIDLKHGAGLGVRLTLPFGQIRMDVATALSESGNPFRLHLSVGADL